MAVGKKHSLAKGRPTKYTPDMCQKIRDFFKTNEKATLASFARSVDVDPSTIYEWANENKDFSESKKKALENKRENLIDMIQGLVVTDGSTKVNSVPLILLARNFGIATSDNLKSEEKNKFDEDFSSAIE